MTASAKSHTRVPRGVWILGFVSMLMDTSSEMIHSILPSFLVSALGLPVAAVGLIDGVAEATALVTKGFSGALSDWVGKRKALALLGYGMAAVSKPMFPLAYNLPTVLIARFLDRVGKGVRGAPRDALLADIAPDHLRGASFGLRQALDSIGALAGPVIAAVLMELTGDNFRIAMWVAVVPAVLCVILLAKGVEEKAPINSGAKDGVRIHPREMFKLGAPYWIFIALATLLTLPRFGEAFLLLRAGNVGLDVALVPLVYVAMNLVYSLCAFPAGSLSDRIGRRGLIAIGFGMLALSDLVLGFASSPAIVFAGAVLWGLHLGLSQGVLSAMVVDFAPARLRATAFGIFYMTTGLAVLAASLSAGELWDHVSPASPFFIGAALTMAALIVFLATPQIRTART